MEIKTKLDVDDDCFYVADNKVIEDVVKGVKVDVWSPNVTLISMGFNTLNNIETDITYVVGKNSDVDEDDIFSTKEQLLLSL